jgi:anti-sigma factor RsiW
MGKAPLFHSDPKRPLKEVTAYLHDELDPETRAAFEEHLESCESCQRHVTVGRKLFPIVNAVIAQDRVLRRPEEYLELWEQAKRIAEKKSREKSKK